MELLARVFNFRNLLLLFLLMELVVIVHNISVIGMPERTVVGMLGGLVANLVLLSWVYYLIFEAWRRIYG